MKNLPSGDEKTKTFFFRNQRQNNNEGEKNYSLDQVNRDFIGVNAIINS